MWRSPKRLGRSLKRGFGRKNISKKNFNFSIPAIKSNMISNNIRPKGSKKDLFEIMCYNYNKKSQYV